MVDFSTPKHSSRGSRGNGLFVAALCLVCLVAYALLEPTIRPPSGWSFGAAVTDVVPN